MTQTHLGWVGIVRLGLVQTSLGAIVVLTTSTMNRVMVVELALPAILPGLLVALHYAVQMLRPRWGHGSDVSGRRTPWIIGGMGVLALGGFGAAVATALMAQNTGLGVALAVLSFIAIGIGVGASGTTLLALLAKRVAPERRAAAASIVWMMMIAGFVVTAGIAGHFLDPFSPQRLVIVTGAVASIAFLLTLAAVWNVEGRAASPSAAQEAKAPGAFRKALREVWAEREARLFTIFVFVSMLAYSMQDLILEPFAGLVFGMTPGESTKLAGVQHGGVLAGMVLVAVAGSLFGGKRAAMLRGWTIGGCLASGVALVGLAIGGSVGPGWPLALNVFLLGLANGAFAVAAIGSMMGLAGAGREGREGTRMGLWGAAQAIAFGLGGFAGAAAVDVCRVLIGAVPVAYSTVFTAEAVLFLVSAVLAARIQRTAPTPASYGPAATPVPAYLAQPGVR